MLGKLSSISGWGRISIRSRMWSPRDGSLRGRGGGGGVEGLRSKIPLCGGSGLGLSLRSVLGGGGFSVWGRMCYMVVGALEGKTQVMCGG